MYYINLQCISEVPLLLVITKIDKVQDIRERLEERVQELKEQLGLLGADEKGVSDGIVLFCSHGAKRRSWLH